MTSLNGHHKDERLVTIPVFGNEDTFVVFVDDRPIPWTDWNEVSAANHVAALRWWLDSEESE